MDYTIDYYSILDVTQTASKEELKAAHRHLAKVHHPDKNPGDANAPKRFRLVQEAYEVLSNDISRHVYDEYRAANKKTTGSSAKNESTNDSKEGESKSAKSRTFSRKHNVWREKRIYVNGRIHVKFQGVAEVLESYMAGREQNYKIFPTETLVVIDSSDIHKNGTPKEYEKAYSSAELFAVPLGQPLRCQVHTAGTDEVYELTIYDLKIKNPTIGDTTRHEQDSFGELTGDCYGYILHQYEETVTENITEYYGATGRVDTKEDRGAYYSRQQFYSKEGAKYWGEWSFNSTATARAQQTKSFTKQSTSQARSSVDSNGKYFAWICYLIAAAFIWPKLVVGLLVIAAMLFLLKLLVTIAASQLKVVRLFSVFLIVAFLLLGMRSLFHPLPAISKTKTTPYQPLDTRRQALKNDQHDTLISHLVQWQDYDSSRYRIELTILQSAVNSSQAEHQSMQSASLTSDGAGAIYAQLYRMDTGKLQYVYEAFDSIIQSKRLNEMQAAEMMMSCIQSIPYFLIVDQSCNAHYNDEFIANYLRNCQNDCCLGNVKFGVQSPAEFIGDLKGDCDTRALLLFDVFSKMGYQVALITSQFYKHAMIAVHFKNSAIEDGLCMPLYGRNYYLWETTSAGHRPGAIPHAISNLQYWNVSLINQQ